MEWSAQDPREVLPNHLVSIVIVRPALTGYFWRAGTGFVDTNHNWSITTSFSDHPTVDSWDPSWRWSEAPSMLGVVP